MSSGVALIAGAVGRPGEALLNRLLASSDYREVVVLAEGQMALGLPRLRLAERHELPQLDDVFILLGEADDRSARSFYGRDAPFVQVHLANLLAVAQAAVAAGARRLVMISPTSAWHQMGSIHRGLGDSTELDVAQLPYESVIVLRPVRQGGRSAANLLQRFANFYMSLQMLMVPRSIPQLTSEQLARVALQAMRSAKAGISVLSAGQLQPLLTDDR